MELLHALITSIAFILFIICGAAMRQDGIYEKTSPNRVMSPRARSIVSGVGLVAFIVFIIGIVLSGV